MRSLREALPRRGVNAEYTSIRVQGVVPMLDVAVPDKGLNVRGAELTEFDILVDINFVRIRGR
jgi:hypothetical protein